MTLHLDDARWRSAVDAHLRDEATPEQAALLQDYTPQAEEHRAEQAFLAALADPPSDAEDTTWLDNAVDVHARTEATTSAYPVVKQRRWPWLAAAAALLLTAGITAATFFGRDSAHRVENFELADLTVEDTPAPAQSPWPIASGAARLAALPIGQSVTIESELCVERPGHSICGAADSRVTARGSGALALHEGAVTIRSQGADDVRVELDDVTVHAAKYSVVVVERQTAGWSVAVQEGGATVTELGSSRKLSAGESLQRGVQDAKTEAALPRKPVSPGSNSTAVTIKASTLLGRARSQRREGDTARAMKTYAELLRTHPRSAAAQTARMSLAQLHLDRGAPKDALRLYRAYVKRGGPLSEDAAYGEIRALRKLGRTKEASKAAEAFVRRYPDSPYGAKLRP